ncbi:MAG: TIGR01777 family oxidoreductase [Nocardioides sp.]|uniref:TIGR01777 family oxidoreductase n=1 Tax=Nocardioides sp. TaxID=35761 RepID=UPI0039E312E1
MTHTFTQQLAAPVEEVFDWHRRPGAIVRLTPPWQPVTVEREAASLRDGTAVLRLPAGRRWIAEHDPSAYAEGRRFADRLASRPFVAPLAWRHEHAFAPGPDDRGTVLTDRVETTAPGFVVSPLFGYRHRQLAGDLAAHAMARALRPTPLTVAVSGSSGLVGTALCALLTTGGHRVIRLVRGSASAADERRWSPEDPASDLLSGVDAVVHLAGANIAGRFTASHRAAIRDSRIGPTRRLAEVAGAAGVGVFVSASAIGLYGADRGDEPLTESSPPGDGFLADVVRDWEAATTPAAAAGGRVVTVRTGIVQSPRGGALRLQRPIFAAGLGGPLGSGEQWLSWIGIDDLLDVYLRALVDVRLSGPVNAVAPHPVTGKEYAGVLGRTLRRPALLPVPRLGPAVLLGRQGADEVALASQRVVPSRLGELGHQFRHPDLATALAHLLGKAPRRVGP